MKPVLHERGSREYSKVDGNVFWYFMQKYGPKYELLAVVFALMSSFLGKQIQEFKITNIHFPDVIIMFIPFIHLLNDEEMKKYNFWTRQDRRRQIFPWYIHRALTMEETAEILDQFKTQVVVTCIETCRNRKMNKAAYHSCLIKRWWRSWTRRSNHYIWS